MSSCAECLRSRKVASLPGESVPPDSANEKMPNSRRRCDRSFTRIMADTAARACMPNCPIKDEASLANGWPG